MTTLMFQILALLIFQQTLENEYLKAEFKKLV